MSAQYDYISKLDSLNKKARYHYYSEKDSAYYYYRLISEIANTINNDSIQIESLFNATGVASYHFDLKKMGKNLNLLDSLVPRTNSINSDNFNYLLYFKGDYYLKLFDYGQSRACFERIIKNSALVSEVKKTETLKSLELVSYSFLGKIFLLEGKYDEAKKLYEKSIRDIKSGQPDNLGMLYNNYNLLAEVLLEEKKYAEANSHWLKTYAYNKKNKNTNSIITNAFHIADSYGYQLKKDSALHYLAEAKTYFNKNPIFYAKYHLGKAKIHRNNWEYEIALIEIDSAIQHIKNNFEGQKNADLAIAYNEKAIVYGLLNQDEKALVNFDLALDKSLENSNKDLFAIKIFKNKASLLNELNEQQGYEKSLETILNATNLLDTLKPGFKSSADKLMLIEDAFPLYESAVHAANKIYSLTHNKDYIEKAFLYSEKSKSVLLLDALLSSQATKFAKIPDDIIENESQLKSLITHTERELQYDDVDKSKLEENLFKLNRKKRELIETLEKEYPDYYNLRYNNEVISLGDIQSSLHEDELLISYFYGDKVIYAIAISKDSKQITNIERSATLENKIIAFYKMLSNPKSDIDSLGILSHDIYCELLKPSLTKKTKKKLIIIPDGLLNYIPFDALNTSETGINYLVEKYAVSSINSATLLNQLHKANPSKNSILAFAPRFNGEPVQGKELRTGLAPLPNNENEVNYILESFNGQPYFGEEASLSNFNTQISKYNVVHLATHAVFNDTSPEYSYLAFTPEDTSDYVLYVSDIYNLKLDADLVTLSACETGVGTLKKGEGALSISRAFFYSGARSLVNTLWNVVDQSASAIMNEFYKNLAHGDYKDVALQKAKLTFLTKNKENALAHPYYWSSFVIQGNTDPLTATPKYWMWILFGVLLLTTIYLTRKKLFQFFK